MIDSDLGNRLRGYFPEYDIRFTLSEHAQAVLTQLDPRWLPAAIGPQVIAHPRANIYLRLTVVDHELLDEHNILDDDRPKPRKLPEPDGYIVLRHKDEHHHYYDVSRHLIMPSTGVIAGTSPYAFKGTMTLLQRSATKVYERLYSATPLALDTYRQLRNTRYENHWALAAPKLHGAHADNYSPTQKRPWMWVAMHWLEPGGAEAWAFEQMKIAREAGYRIVVTADRLAPQRMLDKTYEFADDVYLCGQTFGRREREQFVAHFVEKYRPVALHIHHGALAYDHLALIRTIAPLMRIEDSVHIVEHRGGGFVKASIEKSDLIDLHHVISPELREIYEHAAGIDPAKVRYRPLTGLAQQQLRRETPIARGSKPLRIGFLGRMSPQKRPYLFVEVAHRLHKRSPGGFSFVIQGGGHLEHQTKAHIARKKLSDVMQWRPWGPVEDFFASIDVLLITSDNEGLALTSLEAGRAGVLVVSADVGSQATVVAPGALLPREPHGFIRSAIALLLELEENEPQRLALLARQDELAADLLKKESASHFFAQHYAAPAHHRLLTHFSKEQS